MDNDEKPSTSVQYVDTTQQLNVKDQSTIEIITELTDSLRQGCVCHTKQQNSTGSTNSSTHRFVILLQEILKEFDVAEVSGRNTHNLLIFMTFLRTVAKSAIYPTCYGINEELYCKSLWEWQVVLQRLKFKLLAMILKLWKNVSNKDVSHVRREAEMAFGYILFMIPCPVGKTEDCRKACHKILQSFVKLSYSSNLPLTPGFVLRILHIILCNVEDETDIKRHKQLLKSNANTCLSAKVLIKKDGYSHGQSLRQAGLTELRQQWRNTWVRRFITMNIEICYEDNLYFYDIWKSLVAVNSSLPYSSMRDFVSPALLIVDNLPNETEITIKYKQLDVLNEILCYGSTLAIQSDVPVEVSEISQRLLRRAQPELFFEQFIIPSVPLGMGGNAKIKSQTEEKSDSMIILQKIVILYLKAVAVVVREAQAISSSDESDSSLSSRGSGSVAEEEREMRLIGGNVLHLLNRLRQWINSKISRHHTSDLVSTTCELFNDQDDSLIESLLCLLDIHTSLTCNYNMKASLYGQDEETNMSSLSASIIPTVATSGNLESCVAPSQDMGHLLDIFHPIDGFDCLLQNISHDHSVILDFLLSNETCFLLYFLRILKYFNKNPMSWYSNTSSHARQEVLRKTWSSIKKLTNKSLFPYDISPVLKLLDKIVVLFEGTEKSPLSHEIEQS